jgi:hypothetical protein
VKWQETLLSSLKEQCYALKTSPLLVECLISGITTWFDDRQFPKDDFDLVYQQLISEQAQIGWSQVFQGCLTTQWSLLQQDYYAGFKPVKGQDGTSWSHHIISHILTHWLSLWDKCNKARHGQDSTTRHVAKHKQALQELSSLIRPLSFTKIEVFFSMI